MLRKLKRFARRHPDQAFLLLFNTGIFTWLQTTGLLIASKLGPDSVRLVEIRAFIPDWLRLFVGDHLGKWQSFFGSSPIGWFILSMILAYFIIFLRGLTKAVVMIIIIAVGVYLISKNQQLLQLLNTFG